MVSSQFERSLSLARKNLSLVIRFIVRVLLIAIAFAYVTPYVAGVKFHGDIWGALLASLVFNAAFWGLEALLAVVVFGINIGTLGLGAFLTGAIKFLAALVTPSVALFGASKVVPGAIHISSYYPGAVVYGLMLGGLLWASLPEKKKA